MSKRATLTQPDREFLQAISHAGYSNPFLNELADSERRALGSEYVEELPIWSLPIHDPELRRINRWKMAARLELLAPSLCECLASGGTWPQTDLILYEDAALYLLYHRYYERIVSAAFSPVRGSWRFYQEFRRDWSQFFEQPGVSLPTGHEPAHTLACFCQFVRAFHHIFVHIIGASLPAARLRASVWQSIFTHDLRRYRRSLYNRMGDFATLITGPSGTGKELTARAIALSRYVPFDEQRMEFPGVFDGAFHPINIAALSPTLVESELFGHRRGSFTGAVQDRRGWLETCPPLGAVFLDEIGELTGEIQVKLLRVIDTRMFQPVGDTASKQFQGKLIAATNRNLSEEMREKRFREDFYFRLCSDLITTPSLREQLDDSPNVLRDLLHHMGRRIAGPEAAALAAETEEWIHLRLGSDYAWPGNYRELEQCVRNVLIRKSYEPRTLAAAQDPFAEARQGKLTAEELLTRYCKLVYQQTGSYQETARRLDCDRRTVRRRIEEAPS